MMHKSVIPVLVLAFLVLPLTGQTTGEVLDQKIETIGTARGADSQEIAAAQGLLRNSVPAGALDGGWKVVSPFDSIHVRPLSLKAAGTQISLVMTPEQAEYVDTSGPRGLGASLRTYAFFLGRGLTGTLKAHLERYVGPVQIVYSGAVPQRGFAVVPSLSGFEYKFVMADIVLQTIRVDLDLTVDLYMDGKQIASEVFSLDRYKGEKSFVAVNSGPVAENMVLIMSELVSRSLPFIHSAVLEYGGPPSVKIDMDLVIAASTSWEFYESLKDELSREERGLVHYFLSIDRAYMDSNTDRQAELLSKLNSYVKRSNIEASAREELVEEMRYRYRLREDQQARQNKIDDEFYNFAGEYTETVIDVAEIVPDATKALLLVVGYSNPATASVLAAGSVALATMEGVEKGARFVGAASAEYLHGSGDAVQSLYAGTKASVLDIVGGKAGDALGTAVISRVAAREAAEMSSKAAARGYGDDFARYAAARVYGSRMGRSLEPGKKAAGILTGKGAAYSEEIMEKYTGLNYQVVTNSFLGERPETTELPGNASRIAGGKQ